MNATIVTANFETAVTYTNAAHKLNIRQEPLNAHKIGVLVAMLKILSRNLHVIKLEEAELAELMRVLLKRNGGLPAIKPLLKAIPPNAQLLDVLVHSWLICDEVPLKRLANVRW